MSVSIEASPQSVYDFASDPANLPRWASGLGGSIRFQDGTWVIESPDGAMIFEFVEKNGFGVLDHIVTLKSGEKFYNPMRVIPNGSGSEIIFTLFQTPDMDDQRFAQDAKIVESDLRTLKRVIEGRSDR
jgi:hypothetical protein